MNVRFNCVSKASDMAQDDSQLLSGPLLSLVEQNLGWNGKRGKKNPLIKN
jgi:hypothetical protein